MTKIKFSVVRYTQTHGEGPKGKRTWVFKIDGQTYQASGEFDTAKAEVKPEILKRWPHAGVVTVSVEP